MSSVADMADDPAQMLVTQAIVARIADAATSAGTLKKNPRSKPVRAAAPRAHKSGCISTILHFSSNWRLDTTTGPNDLGLPLHSSTDRSMLPGDANATFEWRLSLRRMVQTMMQVGSSEVRMKCPCSRRVRHRYRSTQSPWDRLSPSRLVSSCGGRRQWVLGQVPGACCPQSCLDRRRSRSAACRHGYAHRSLILRPSTVRL